MIKSIKAKNFQSWESLEISFANGTTLVDGINIDDNTSEGSGKSAIFNSIVWCLYGKLPKDTNIDDVMRLGEKSCSVMVEFENGLIVARNRNPNQLYFLYSDEKICQAGKDMKDTQRIINERIGLSFETFCQSIYFPQNYEKKFITSNEEEKGKILSEIQDLTIFDKASKKSAEIGTKVKTEIAKLENTIQMKDLLWRELKNQLSTFENLSNKYESKKATDLKSYNEQLSILDSKVQAMNSKLLNLPKLRDVKEVRTEFKVINDELREVENKLYAIELIKNNSKNTICPTCNRALDNCVVDIPDNTDLLVYKDIIEAKQHKLSQEESDINERKLDLQQIKSGIGYLEQERTNYLRNIKTLENGKNEYEDKIQEIAGKLVLLMGELTKLKYDLNANNNYLTKLLFLKDGFKEIKSHVFQSLLNDLNVKSNFYINEFFDIPCSIEFTNISEDGELSKIQTKVTLNNKIYTLGLLSGGQFRRVQLAVDFAISEIISARSNKKVDLRILDEPFKDLSEDKMLKILAFLKQMPGKTVIVEHNSIVKAFVDQELNVELKDGVSRLID